MKQINPAHKSKINYTALVMALVGLAVAFDLIPAEAEQPLAEATLIVGPMLVGALRTWFT